MTEDTGIPFEELLRAPACGPQLPPVQQSDCHTVLYQIPVDLGEIPKPYPCPVTDRWDEDHVRMPYSVRNLYVTYNEDGTKESEQKRWDIIKTSLSRDFKSAKDVTDAILTYNAEYREVWTFAALTSFIEEELEEEESVHVLSKLLPAMANLALRLPQLVTQPIPLQRRSQENKTQSISLSQLQVASLLANAFFCTFPCRSVIWNSENQISTLGQEYRMFPGINFYSLFEGKSLNKRVRAKPGAIPKYRRVHEKLRCLFCYFRIVTQSQPLGTLTFTRKSVFPANFPRWIESVKTFPQLYISPTGTIEDGVGCLQVDFANRFIGGGVLARGCVQEEIRFVAWPELLVSMLWSEAMANNEAIVITGCEQYSDTKGYSDTFEWNGVHSDNTPRDSEGRHLTQVVAIDATRLSQPSTQYELPNFRRETNKAYVGYLADSVPENSKPCAVATGNWGCGAFRGDPRLKYLLQMMAAAEAGRTELAYYTFGNVELHNDLLKMSRFLEDNGVSVGQLWKILAEFHATGYRASKLFDFIYESFGKVPIISHEDKSHKRKEKIQPEDFDEICSDNVIAAMFSEDFDMDVADSTIDSTPVEEADVDSQSYPEEDKSMMAV